MFKLPDGGQAGAPKHNRINLMQSLCRPDFISDIKYVRGAVSAAFCDV
jgi:hypothetical protein